MIKSVFSSTSSVLFHAYDFLFYFYFFSFGVTGRRQKVVNRTSISTLGTHMNGEEESVNGDMTCKYGTHQFTGSDWISYFYVNHHPLWKRYHHSLLTITTYCTPLWSRSHPDLVTWLAALVDWQAAAWQAEVRLKSFPRYIPIPVLSPLIYLTIFILLSKCAFRVSIPLFLVMTCLKAFWSV